MNKQEVERFLLSKPGYIKCSPIKVAKRMWKKSSKNLLPKTEGELEKELKLIAGVLSTLRVASTINKDVQEDSLMDMYHSILNQKEREPRLLFIDIETSFNIIWSWSIGRKINLSTDNILEERKLICVSYKFSDEGKIKTIAWKDNCDKKLLEELVKVIEKADCVITHNGDAFDLKHIRARCAFHGIKFPIKVNSIDTLKLARKAFKFNSNKLQYLGEFLGLGSKVDTGGIDLWKAVILDKNKEALAHMCLYCEGDIELLEKVYNKLKVYFPKKRLR